MPTPHVYPCGHALDWFKEIMPCTPSTRPAGPGRQLEMSGEPFSGLYVPVGHSRHVTESACDRYRPAGQISGSYVPYPAHVNPDGHTRHWVVPVNGA